jgi:aspartate kinase
MNPQAVEFARKAGIAIYARATGGAPGEGGTRIGGPAGEARGAVGVTGMNDLVRVRVRGGEAAGEALATLLGAEGVRVLRLAADESGALALFSTDDLPDWSRVRGRLESTFGGDQVTFDEGLGAVTAVGEGLGSDARALGRALSRARALGVTVLGFDASPLRLTLYVPPASLPLLVPALHAEFVA